MWYPDDADDAFSDIRLAFGHRYARHLCEAAGLVLPDAEDFACLGALWVQRVLRRGELWRDCDGDTVVLRLPIGPWTFDFAFEAGTPCAVRAGLPDTLFRDGVPATLDDWDDAALARLRAVLAGDGRPPIDELPDLARLPGRD